MSRIITYGTFDMFHFGHLALYTRIKQPGDYLIVGCSTDKFNSLKEKVAFENYEKRKENIEATGLVDLVIPEENWEQKTSDIIKYGVDIFLMGSDWQGKFDHLNDLCKVVYLPRTRNISSTYMRELHLQS
jgi:glycerol-3-phosphate cytidylyltransferase